MGVMGFKFNVLHYNFSSTYIKFLKKCKHTNYIDKPNYEIIMLLI